MAGRFAYSVGPFGIGCSTLNPESLPVGFDLEIGRRVGCPTEASVVRPAFAIGQFRERKMFFLPGFQPIAIRPARLAEAVPKRGTSSA